MNKQELLVQGHRVMLAFCNGNQLPAPTLRPIEPAAWHFGVCAYYRNGVTSICVPKCAAIGTVGRMWSFPGYTVDRTPYGVLQHELGHHVDVTRASFQGQENAKILERVYYSDFSRKVRAASGEKPITSYCPNDAEWFAEMFRVFVTNPDLLKLVRPRTHRELRACFLPLFTDTWRERLAGAPERTLAMAEKRIEEALAA